LKNSVSRRGYIAIAMVQLQIETRGPSGTGTSAKKKEEHRVKNRIAAFAG
jgi:hypothetical protein